MKLVVPKSILPGQAPQFLRSAGYAFIIDHRDNKESFVRRLESGHYPRLHMYVEDLGDKVSFNLHLDQKQVTYAGQSRHGAEYDGPVVEAEINHLRSILRLPPHGNDGYSGRIKGQQREEPAAVSASVPAPVPRIGRGHYDKSLPKKSKSWWERIFGA
jgi:hypothetical protein